MGWWSHPYTHVKMLVIGKYPLQRVKSFVEDVVNAYLLSVVEVKEEELSGKHVFIIFVNLALYFY